MRIHPPSPALPEPAATPGDRAPRGARKKGFTLVLTLIILAAITLLVVGLLANVTSETSTATNYENAFRAQTAVRSGLARVEALLQRGTWSDDYLVLEHLQNPPPLTGTLTEEPLRNRRPVLVLARPKLTGDTNGAGYTATWEYTPLTSGVNPPPNTQGLPSLPLTPLSARVDPVSQNPAATATNLPKRLPWQAPQSSFWEVLYEERDTDSNPQTPPVQVPVARYCFQVEDLQGYLSLDHAGNPGDEIENTTGMLTRAHQRERFQVFETAALVNAAPRRWYMGLAPGLRTPDDDPTTDDRRWVTSQAALFSLMHPTRVNETPIVAQPNVQGSGPSYQWDNMIMQARHTTRTGSPLQVASLLAGPDAWKALLMKQDTGSSWSTWLQRAPVRATGTTPRAPEEGRLQDVVNSPARRLEENTVAGLLPYHEYALIPPEPGVIASPRKPKLNLNRVLSLVEGGGMSRQDAVELIARHIKTHLPEFDTRAGAFPLVAPAGKPAAYLQSLAAGILDYADSDCLPTVDPDSALASVDQGVYRGCDSFPLVNESFLLSRWEETTQSNGRWKMRFSVTFYYELWNMTNRPVTGTFQAEYSNRAKVTAGISNQFDLGASFDKIELGSAQPVVDGGTRWLPLYAGTAAGPNTTTTVVTILPNEHKVLGTRTVTFAFDAGSTTLFPVIDPPDLDADLLSHYRIRFLPSATVQNPPLYGAPAPTAAPGGWTVIDRTRSRLDRKPRPFSNAGNRTIASGTMASSSGNLNASGTLGNFVNNTGDPRASFFYGTDMFQAAVAYTGGASPGGRNFRPSIGADYFYKEVFPSKWGDRGHDSTPYGNTPGGQATTPFAVTPVFPASGTLRQMYMDRAPQRISNAGRYFSVTELGNIFDPLFWDPNGTAANPDGSASDAGWSTFWDIGSSATPSSVYCGGHTLRIGRPEHTRWRTTYVQGSMANRRLCASTLLDLFHCGISTVGNPATSADNLRDLTGPLTEVRGHVNLNTASRDVLRALVAGTLAADPAITHSISAPRTTSSSATEADLLVDAIIRGRPYLSAAQLLERTRTSSNQPILGNPSLASGWVATSSKWSDAAAEECFARLYNSSTVRSRNFRVFVTGQAIRPKRSDPTQFEVLSTRSRVFHVFARPLRDPSTGLIHDQRVDITYEQDL